MRKSRFSLKRDKDLRALRTVDLTPSGLRLESNSFEQNSGHFVEFDVKFLGNIPRVPLETDTTNRTEVLKIVDKGKKRGLVPHLLSSENDAFLFLNREMVQVNRRNMKEERLLVLPLHEIAHVCYVLDEKQHILAIKHGTPEELDLAVFLCGSESIAEAICSLVSCCFHLVYSEAMVDLIEDKIGAAIKDDCRSLTSVSSMRSRPQFVSGSVASLVPPSPIPLGSEVSGGESQADVLREYMWQLNSKLKPEELKTFSSYLKDWNYSSNKLQEFCENLYKLYGPKRKYLLKGMYPFIPERDCKYFERFLKKHDVTVPGFGSLSTLPGYPPQFYTRSISDFSINSFTGESSNADYDSELEALGNQFDTLGFGKGHVFQSYM